MSDIDNEKNDAPHGEEDVGNVETQQAPEVEPEAQPEREPQPEPEAQPEQHESAPQDSTEQPPEPQRTESPSIQDQNDDPSNRPSHPSTAPHSTRSKAGHNRSGSNQRASRGGTQRRSADRSSRPTSRGRASTSRSRSRSRSRDRKGVTRNFIDSTDPNLGHTIERYQRSPGPVYDTSKEKEATMRSSFHATIGHESRDKFFALPTLSPGPKYTPDSDKSSAHPQSPRATFGKAPLKSCLIRETVVEGPPKDAVDLEKVKGRSFRATFGSAPRGGPGMKDSPGPADYNGYEPSKHSSKGGTFSKADRGTGAWIFQ